MRPLLLVRAESVIFQLSFPRFFVLQHGLRCGGIARGRGERYGDPVCHPLAGAKAFLNHSRCTVTPRRSYAPSTNSQTTAVQAIATITPARPRSLARLARWGSSRDDQSTGASTAELSGSTTRTISTLSTSRPPSTPPPPATGPAAPAPRRDGRTRSASL